MINYEKELQRIKTECKIYDYRSEFIKNTTKHMNLNGDIFEFGVFTGRSLRLLSDLFPERKIFGFDSFEGLPEAWPGSFSKTHPKGHFNTNGLIPKINNPNITFVKGFFENTLADFMNTYTGSIALLHIDCDIYSSTKTILNNIKTKISSGMIIIFDELIGYDGFEINEMKAWLELVEETKIEYKYLYSSKYQVSLIIQ